MIVGRVVAPDRIPCCIGGCGRTAPRSRFPDSHSILCSKCYRHASRPTRRRLRRFEKLCASLDYSTTAPGSRERHLLVIYDRIWQRLVGEIIEAKAGLS